MSHRTPSLKGQVALLQKTLVEKGVSIASSLAHEAIAKVNGFSSWNVAAKAAAPAPAPAQASVACASPHAALVSVFEINMTDVLPEYDVPDEQSAWSWVQAQASFSHVDNGIGAGVWEFLVLASKIKHDQSSIPETIKAEVLEGLKTDAKWLLFYQW
jgi:hypothetical protein